MILNDLTWRKSSFSGNGGDCVEVAWRKSSFSADNGGCVEVAWRKSTFSGGDGGCVEVGWPVTGVAVRDSKNVTGPTIAFPTKDWRAFLATLPG